MTKITDTNFQKGGLMLLIDILGKLKLERDIEQITYDQYERSVRRYDAYLKRASTTDDLEPEQLNNWLIWLGQTYGLGPQSLINYRTGIIRVWNYATELGLAPACPVRRIRRPKLPQRIVSAWTLDQLRILLDTAAKLPGFIRGQIPASDFLVACGCGSLTRLGYVPAICDCCGGRTLAAIRFGSSSTKREASTLLE